MIMKKFIQKISSLLAQTTTLNQYQFNSSSSPVTNTINKKYIFRELTLLDLKQNTIFQEKNRLSRYSNHFNKGHRCYGFITPKGDVAAYFWLTLNENNQPIANPAFKGINWIIQNNEAYIWDCRTLEAYQRQGLYREGLKRLAHLCQQKHIAKIMINCKPDNYASNTGIKSAGFILKGTVFTLKTKLFKLVLCTKKYLKFSIPAKPVTSGDVFPWN